MTATERSDQVVASVKIAILWLANYFTLTNLNAVLSTLALVLTLAYSWLQIDKLLREREAALRSAREADLKAALNQSTLDKTEENTK